MARSMAAGEVSIPMPRVLRGRRRKSAASKQERRLNGFVRFVALWEWAGNAFGTLAFLWATVVLLGAYGKDIKHDFWCATAIIFIEAFRMFSRNYRLDDQSLFRTTRAIRAIFSPFVRMLVRPQEWNELAAIMGLSIYLVYFFLPQLPETLDVYLYVLSILMAVFIVFMSKLRFPGAMRLMSRPRRYRRWLLWAILVALLIIAASFIMVLANKKRAQPLVGLGKVLLGDEFPVYDEEEVVLYCALQLAVIVEMAVAVLLLNFRPPSIANLTDRPYGRILLSLAKVILVMNWISQLVLLFIPIRPPGLYFMVDYIVRSLLDVPLATLVLSLGSLQTPATANSSPSSHLIDITLHICFFGQLVYLSGISDELAMTAMLVVLLIGSLQIPAAIARIVLSSVRLRSLHRNNYSDKILATSIVVFYVLTLCQGTLYIVACVSDIFSFFLRRSLARQSGLRGKRGTRAIDLYYHNCYLKCMETGILAAGREISLASFAIESLRSSSHKVQLAGLLILDSLLQQREELVSRITCCSKAVCSLIGMLGWTDVRDRDIRLFAARVTAKLAGSLRVTATPGMLQLVSSLLDGEDQLETALSSAKDAGSTNSPSSGRMKPRIHDSYVSRRWRRLKERWTVPAERPLTHQDSFPVLGMLILQRLASDHDNCAEICRATNLISKITDFISYNSSNSARQKAVVCSSLNLVRTLASTGGKIGAMLRQELWEDPFLLDNIASMLEDSRSSIKVWEPAMDTIAKLALVEEARQEIGRNKVIIRKLMHAFLGRNGPTDMHYSQQLRLAAGEALANLATENTANCLAILEEPQYELIKDLKDMLSHDKYIYVAASLLQNLCTHCRDKIHRLGANDHLSYALPWVMDKTMAVEGKHMETLIGLALQICSIIPECVHFLDSHLDVSAFVRKMVSALLANKKPSPEYPRLRRVIVELTISIIESHPRYTTIFIKGGMLEALSVIESIPSKVERYRIFLGNAGVALERGLPLPIIVGRAKGLFDSTTLGAHH